MAGTIDEVIVGVIPYRVFRNEEVRVIHDDWEELSQDRDEEKILVIIMV